MEKEVFDKVKFLKGFLTKWGIKFIIWVVSSAFVAAVVFAPVLFNGFTVPEAIQLVFVIAWIIISILYFLHKIDEALSVMVSNAKLAAEYKFAMQKNITTNTADVIKAAKE